MLKKLSLVLAVSLLSACSTTPESLVVAENTELVQYQQVVTGAEQSKGKIARWGGVIAEISNQPDATVLEMVHFPIKSYGRPISGDQSVGRFKVYVSGFLDPMVYKVGRSITFVGQVLGTEKGKVGEQDYTFPTLHADNYHLWKELPDVEVAHIEIWPHHYGYYGWYGWPYHHRSYVIKRTRNSHHSPSVSNREISPTSGGGSVSSQAKPDRQQKQH